MPLLPPSYWTDALERTLERYDEPLLRQVAARLIKPRNQWPADDLIRRCIATATDVGIIDRRLKELDPAGRQLMALIGHSRQPRWHLGGLVELAIALGHADGLKPVFDLLEAGLLYPWGGSGTIRSFEQWLTFGTAATLQVFAHPLAPARAVGEPLPLGDLDAVTAAGAPQEADGLDWLLRLAVLWQQVAAAPLRRTQQGEFFKRDLERLASNPLLNSPVAEGTAAVPDAGFLAVSLAELEGTLREVDGELRAAALPGWEDRLAPAVEALAADLFRLEGWNALDGWRHGEPGANPFPSAYLLALALLTRLPPNAWTRPADVQAWLWQRHPYWAGEDLRPSRQREWASAFLLGLAYQLRLVQAARADDGDWVVRLSPLGRWFLGLGETPAADPAFPRTLLVQPNLEILAYRQGLTPALVGRLTLFATWKLLGAACTLQVEPESVYRALEAGQTFETLLQTLEQHGTRATPPAVVDSLRTWASKRDRLTVYPSAMLLEFNSAAELNEALARGLNAVRIAERLAVAAGEGAIDYSHFRLAATRDYALPPEKCVEVEEDGVTLSVDLSRSDLLLETEITRFAEPADTGGGNGRRLYRLTPASLATARAAGMHAGALEQWFAQRTGGPPSPAAVLLLTGAQSPPPRLQPHLVLHVASEALADGLMQWPQTRGLIAERLGPTALSVAAENAGALGRCLGQLGVQLTDGASRPTATEAETPSASATDSRKRTQP